MSQYERRGCRVLTAARKEAGVRPAAVMPAQAQEGDDLQDQEGGACVLCAENHKEDQGKR